MYSKSISNLEYVISKLELLYGEEKDRSYILKGATNSIKVSVDFSNKFKFFLKSGEKVDIENFWYSKVKKDSGIFIENLVYHQDVLVVPFLNKTDLSDLYSIDIDLTLKLLDNFLKFDYLNYLTFNNQSNKLFIKKYIKKSYLKFLYIEKFPFFELTWLYKEKLPSIKNMFLNVTNEILSLPSFPSSNMIGDLQLPNMILYDRKVKIVDITNLLSCGDYAYDLAKIINFLKRFFLVSNYRDSMVLNNKLYISYKNEFGSLFLEDNTIDKGVSLFVDDIIDFFGYRFNDENLSYRVKLYSFLVNFYTFQRHANLSNLYIDLCIFCIIDSYYDLIT